MSTSLRGMYWTAGYEASRSVSASRVFAMTRPATDTTTRFRFGSIVIGWSGLGSLMVFVVMASSSFIWMVRRHHDAYEAVFPPLTPRIWPVTKDALSDAR